VGVKKVMEVKGGLIKRGRGSNKGEGEEEEERLIEILSMIKVYLCMCINVIMKSLYSLVYTNKK
jgi:hypothetical protein